MSEAASEEQNFLKTVKEDGHYRCDNPDCELGQGPGAPGFFTGGGMVENEETHELEFQKGVCPTCKKPGTEVEPGVEE